MPGSVSFARVEAEEFAGGSSPCLLGSEASPGKASSRGRPGVSLTSALLERLLSEVDCAQECSEDDLECPGSRTAVASFKSFGDGAGRHKKGQLCRRRVRFWHNQGFRLLDRNGLFGQSKGVWSVQNVVSRNNKKSQEELGKARSELKQLCAEDLYHLFLDAKLSVQLLVVLLTSLFLFCFFALIFLIVEEPCGLKLEYSFLRAYMLSVETMTTIGYGVSDPYMQGCWQGPILLTAQSLTQMLISAVVIGVVYQGICRPQSRASTVVFSEKAVINCEDGAHYLQFRVADLRVQHSLIEPHVRCYCLHSSKDGAHIESVPMELERPADGAALLPLLPNLISHRIDARSPLAPHVGFESRSARSSINSVSSGTGRPSIRSTASTGVSEHGPQKQRFEVHGLSCPTCGQDFESAERLRLHCRYLSQIDALSGVPDAYRHRAFTEEELEQLEQLSPAADPSRDNIEAFLAQGYFEVVVLVEGTEPTTGASVQKRHSYVVSGAAGSSDVVWDASLEECCRIRADGSTGVVVDLGRFNSLQPTDR